MNPRWLERQSRVLLSWRERAREAAAGRHPVGSPEEALAAAREAQHRLDALRAEAQAHVDRLAQRLARGAAAQERILASVQAGSLPPARANRRNRRVAREIAALRAEIDRCRTLIAADTATAAGGFIDLALSQYRAVAGQPAYLRWGTMDPADRRTVIIAGIAVLVCVLGAWAYLRAGRAPEFGAALGGNPPDRLVVWCHNHALAPVRLELDAGSLPLAPRAGVYQLEIAVRGVDGAFQALRRTAAEDGDAPRDPEWMIVDPGLHASHHLALDRLVPPGMNPEALRVRVLRRGGGAAFEAVWPWPSE